MLALTPSRRIRSTPFSAGVAAAGAKSYTVYNHMLLPTQFSSLEEDYHHLKQHVQVWDVACQRQISVSGPDAGALMDLISPRDLSLLADDQCFYMPVVTHAGRILNDPVTMRVGKDHFWLSIASGDLLQYVLGVADARQMDVTITEPDISPLAIQGPKAEELLVRVLGPSVRSIKFFRFKWYEICGVKHMVARSGFSGQGGFEIYVNGSQNGMNIWETLFKYGEDLSVKAGCPNLVERVESGLLSYGNDMTLENSPFECGLGHYCNSKKEYLGKSAIDRERLNGADRMIRALEIQGDIPNCDRAWTLNSNGDFAGQVTSAAYSPDQATNVAIAMVEKPFWDPGTQVVVRTPAGEFTGTVREKFWNKH